MESSPAATLQKNKIHKGKLKKTIKNILCRPDPVFWPIISDQEKESFQEVICKYKLAKPEFKKPLWKDVKSLPKDKRPKPPKIERVEGLIFGIGECSNAIQAGACAAIAIEAAVNPRAIVQTLLDLCVTNRIPAVCMEGLRKITAKNFGIPTSCMGIKKDKVPELNKVLMEIGGNKLPKVEHKASLVQIVDTEMVSDTKDKNCLMDVDTLSDFQYLHRTNKKARVFVPPSSEPAQKKTKKFVGQDFIEFSESQDKVKKPFMKMVVKRVVNNSKRVKVK